MLNQNNPEVTDDNHRRIDALIAEKQYRYTDAEKEALLLPIMVSQLKNHYKNNLYIRSWLDKLQIDIDQIRSLEEIPLLPTQMFKFFDLQTSPDKLQRVLFSSSTTSQTPSKIPINSVTARRQTKAMVSIIKNHFSGKRRPFLVIDSPANNKESSGITARGAAIRGFSILAKELVYAFDDQNGRMVLNRERVHEFLQKYREEPIFALGFTFVIWSEFLAVFKKSGESFHCPNLTLVHGGGWKKLQAQSVSKDEFSESLALFFGNHKQNIHDYYGMVEQTGVVFIDCKAGYKHAPNFADVKIRNFYSLKENRLAEPGYIEVMSILPDSYPGMSILTEDVGEVIGVDDCPCGRKGKYFVFRSRVLKSEPRGCGDTFRED